MTEQECLDRMVAPGERRKGKYLEGVIQVWVTRACDKSCFGCTQGSNLGGKPGFMSPELFRRACRSLKEYFGVVGMFGGNPALHPDFVELCQIMREEVPDGHRGIWSNNPITVARAAEMRRTFDPSISNLNVHLDGEAYKMFKQGWPECGPVGLHQDSRHSPPFVAMKDVVKKDCPECGGTGWFGFSADDSHGQRCGACDENAQVPDDSRIWELISGCDINQHWSAMIGVFRGQLRAWFCEIAGAQSMLHQDEPDYPDTGLDPLTDKLCGPWWKEPITTFASQVRKHCFDCGVPLRGYGELSQSENGCEQTSETHAEVYYPKRRDRPTQCVDRIEQLGMGRLRTMTHYLQNSKV